MTPLQNISAELSRARAALAQIDKLTEKVDVARMDAINLPEDPAARQKILDTFPARIAALKEQNAEIKQLILKICILKMQKKLISLIDITKEHDRSLERTEQKITPATPKTPDAETEKDPLDEVETPKPAAEVTAIKTQSAFDKAIFPNSAEIATEFCNLASKLLSTINKETQITS